MFHKKKFVELANVCDELELYKLAKYIDKRLSKLAESRPPKEWEIYKQEGSYYVKDLKDHFGEDTMLLYFYPDGSGDVDAPFDADKMHGALYDLFQTNDDLKEGDTFNTPFGKFIAKDVHIIPHKENNVLDMLPTKQDKIALEQLVTIEAAKANPDQWFPWPGSDKEVIARREDGTWNILFRQFEKTADLELEMEKEVETINEDDEDDDEEGKEKKKKKITLKFD